jgi:hypothetical protein
MNATSDAVAGATPKRKSHVGALLVALGAVIAIPVSIVVLNPTEVPPSASLTVRSDKAVAVAPQRKASAPPRAERIAYTDKIRGAVEHLLSTGLARTDDRLHKVWIDHDLWSTADATMKEEIAASFAIRFAAVNSTDAYRAEIYGAQSGKRLARYSEAFGFTVD